MGEKPKKPRTPLSEYTDEEIFAEAGQRMRRRQTHMPNPPVLRPCPHCGEPFAARALRVHLPRCPQRKPKPGG